MSDPKKGAWPLTGRGSSRSRAALSITTYGRLLQSPKILRGAGLRGAWSRLWAWFVVGAGPQGVEGGALTKKRLRFARRGSGVAGEGRTPRLWGRGEVFNGILGGNLGHFGAIWGRFSVPLPF